MAVIVPPCRQEISIGSSSVKSCSFGSPLLTQVEGIIRFWFSFTSKEYLAVPEHSAPFQMIEKLQLFKYKNYEFSFTTFKLLVILIIKAPWLRSVRLCITCNLNTLAYTCLYGNFITSTIDYNQLNDLVLHENQSSYLIRLWDRLWF